MPTRSQILRKDQILSALAETRQNILAEISTLSPEQHEQIFLGIWSLADLLAHFIGWDHSNLRAAQAVLKGRLPSFYKHRDRDWHKYNAMLVRKYKKGSFEELLAASRESQRRLLEYVRGVPAEHFNKDFGVRFRGYKVTIQRLLEAEQHDERVHLQQITDFFKGSN